jgi:hypothetical protein
MPLLVPTPSTPLPIRVRATRRGCLQFRTSRPFRCCSELVVTRRMLGRLRAQWFAANTMTRAALPREEVQNAAGTHSHFRGSWKAVSIRVATGTGRSIRPLRRQPGARVPRSQASQQGRTARNRTPQHRTPPKTDRAMMAPRWRGGTDHVPPRRFTSQSAVFVGCGLLCSTTLFHN